MGDGSAVTLPIFSEAGPPTRIATSKHVRSVLLMKTVPVLVASIALTTPAMIHHHQHHTNHSANCVNVLHNVTGMALIILKTAVKKDAMNNEYGHDFVGTSG